MLHLRETKVKGINLIPLVIYYGAGFYEGAVWNLWNAKNYSGSFLSGGLFGVSVFFSPEEIFMGPWGITKDYSFYAVPFTRKSSGSATYYALQGEPFKGTGEGEVLAALVSYKK